MTPSILRQSGPKYVRDGATFTPRAVIHFCEVCSAEGAPFGFTDASGKRTYFCGEHKPERQTAQERNTR